MPGFPFYRYSYPYYYKNPRTQRFYNNSQNICNKNVEISDESKKLERSIDDSSDNSIFINNHSEQNNFESRIQMNKEKTSRYNSFGPINFQNPFDVDSDEPILEILGIKLYLDDIIILSLLFFLYKEGVKDEMLFLTLFLLFLS